MITTILLKNKFPFYFTKATSLSFSEEGEDIVLRKLFNVISKGFYVDISNFDKSYSNTFFFYKSGWTGLNIYNQPIERSVTPLRSRDINIYKTIGLQNRVVTTRSFDATAKNTVNLTQMDHVQPLITNKIETTTLDLTLKQHLPFKDGSIPNIVDIDILNIDVKGEELNIILSNNWKIYRPKVIVVTDSDNSYRFSSDSPVFENIRAFDYIFFAKTSKTLMFRERNFLPA